MPFRDIQILTEEEIADDAEYTRVQTIRNTIIRDYRDGVYLSPVDCLIAIDGVGVMSNCPCDKWKEFLRELLFEVRREQGRAA